MRDCPCLKYNWQKEREECNCTGKPPQDTTVCDFDFDEECKTYASHKNKSLKDEKK